MESFKHLNRLLMIAAVVVLCLPLYDMVYIYPSTLNLLTESLRRDAEGLAACFIDDSLLAVDEIRTLQHLSRIKESLRLVELTVRNSRGELLGSTCADVPPRINFPALPLLQQGRTFSRNLTVASKVQGGVMSLVEVQVPMLVQGQLDRVVILTRDVSPFRAVLEREISKATIFLLAVCGIFLALILMVARMMRKTVQLQYASEADLSESRAELEHKHRELEQLFNQVEQAKYEWQCALDCIDDMILLIDEEGLIRRCNDALVRFLGCSYLNVLGKNWRQVLKVDDRGMISLNRQNGQVYHQQNGVWLQLEFYPYATEQPQRLTVLRIRKQG
ncbi:MAG: PAS domain S-box protein [Desulfuromonadales bacterium]|nr:PAS domain S-box protein [Desulfuromonadales bacterium]MBN2791669.1 PAS domain S-box protein [Desulfuromonadales bacterium]